MYRTSSVVTFMNGHFLRSTTSAKSISWVSTIVLGEKKLGPLKSGTDRKFSDLPNGLSRSLEESSLPRATVADGCLRKKCIAARNQTFASYLSLKLSVIPLHAGLP